MAEYIERETLQAALVRKRCGVANQRYTEGWNDCLLRVKSMVSKAPAADVAPVVRCKDCAHRTEMGNCGHPRYHGILPPAHPYDFCSYGARMNGDSNDLEAMKDGD